MSGLAESFALYRSEPQLTRLGYGNESRRMLASGEGK
jgi:hypothetical protein